MNKAGPHRSLLNLYQTAILALTLFSLSISLLPASANPRLPSLDAPKLRPSGPSLPLLRQRDFSYLNFKPQSPTRLCIAITVNKGSLSGEAFVDRFTGLLKGKEQTLVAAVLENANDPATRKQDAAKEGCHLLLSMTVAGDSPQFRLPFGAKYKLEVQYRIEDVSGNQPAFDGAISEKGKDTEGILRSVQDKIVASVLSRVSSSTPSTDAASTRPAQTSEGSSTATATSAGKLFDSKSRPRLVVQTSHTAMVTDFIYSPNGKLLATLGADGVVKLWLASKGHEIVSIPGYQVVGMAFHPDSRRIACLSKNGVLRIFDVSTAGIIHRLTPIKSGGGSFLPFPKLGKGGEDSNPFFNLPSPVAFSSSGNILVSGGNGGVKVWDISKSRVLYQMANNQYVPVVALSNDGATVAGVLEGYRIKLWSTATGKETRVINTDVARLSAMTFSLDGTLIACGNINGTLKVYNVATGKEVKQLIEGSGGEDFIGVGRKIGRVPILGDIGDAAAGFVEGINDLRNLLFTNRSIRAVAFHPDNKSLAYQAGDNIIHVLKLEDGKEILTVEQDDPFDTDDKKSKGAVSKVSGAITKKSGDGISPFFRQLCPIRYSTDGATLNGCKNFKNIQRWDSVTGKELSTLAVAKRGSIKGQKVPIPFPLTTVPRFVNDRLLFTSSFAGGVKLWDLEKRSNPQRIVEMSPALGNNLPVSTDGKLLMRVSPDERTLSIQGLDSKTEVRSFAVEEPANQKIIAAQFSPDSKLVAIEVLEEKVRLKIFASRKVQLRIMDISSGQRVFDASNILENQFSFSPDTKKFAYMPKGQSIWDSYRNKTEIQVYEIGPATGWRKLYEKDVEKEFDSNFVSKVVFSSDSTMLASEDRDTIKVWQADNGKQLHEHKLDLGTYVSSFVFVPKRNVLTYTIFSKIYSWDLTTRRVEKLRIETDLWGSLAYSPDGRTIALGGVENKVRLFNVDTQDELGNLIAPNEDDWMITTPEGRFDTSRLDEIEEVHWILPNEPFNPEAVEVFMRQFYEPRLLSRLLYADDFQPVPDLSQINRAQPFVKIKEVVPVNADTVRVTVEVASLPSETQTDAQGQPRQSGVFDVRLFRNGQLVGYTTPVGKLMELAQRSGTAGSDGELAAWRQANQISVDPATGKKLVTFDNVKVPQRAENSRLVFSSYAFNEDRVKSLTDRVNYELPAAPQPRKGRAYIISVGVSAFENSSFNLEFSDNDAREIQSAIGKNLANSGQFSEVINVTLTSDSKLQGGRTLANENLATKENFRRVLARLSNRVEPAASPNPKPPIAPTPNPTKPPARGKRPQRKSVAPPAPKQAGAEVPQVARGMDAVNLDKIRPATPDDFVLILYSSHGYADRAGNFYLIPYDTGPGTKKIFDENVRQRSIGSEELSFWLRDVDAGELVFIVDACHSTAAVEGLGFKPGPMGSRGLGQMSYDKGMRILTATQADNIALESRTIQQSVLTYALTVDGLTALRADFKPVDKTVTLLEWLEYGEDRVPTLSDEIRGGQISSAVSNGGDKPRLIVFEVAKGLEQVGAESPAGGGANASTDAGVIASARAKGARLQQPSLFDFSRGQRDTILARSQ